MSLGRQPTIIVGSRAAELLVTLRLPKVPTVTVGTFGMPVLPSPHSVSASARLRCWDYRMYCTVSATGHRLSPHQRGPPSKQGGLPLRHGAYYGTESRAGGVSWSTSARATPDRISLPLLAGLLTGIVMLL